MAKTLMPEEEAYRLLRGAGVPVPPSAQAATRAEAIRAAEEIGFPVVMKIVSPDVVHKTDAGGVVLDIGDETQLRASWERMSAVLGAQMLPAVVQRFADAGMHLVRSTDPLAAWPGIA